MSSCRLSATTPYNSAGLASLMRGSLRLSPIIVVLFIFTMATLKSPLCTLCCVSMVFFYSFNFCLVYPKITARVTTSSLAVYGIYGSVGLVCEAIAGDPPISYSWTGPDGLSPGDTDGSITVTISTYGDYTCAATNDVGTRRVTLETVTDLFEGK